MIKEDFLLSLVEKYPNHIWLGDNVPFVMAKACLYRSTNFHLSPIHHQAYDVVWLYEYPISGLKTGAWKIVLDESIRLIKETGYIVVRFCETEELTILNIKHFFGRHYGINVSVAWEKFNNNEFTIAFAIHRKNIEIYNNKLWSFVILAQGNRMENTLAFLKSIRDMDKDFKHEIIVVGPKFTEYEPYGVVCVEKEYREELKEVALKKNDAAAIAKNANLMIVHDRYILNQDFFTGFAQYGYDFDLLTIKQWYEDGTEFPSYCALSRPTLSWSTPIQCDDYNTLRPTQYINGGLVIAKTQTMRDIGFNPMSFWGQGEDVELTYSFMLQGIIPRMNYMSSATTIGIEPSYTGTFLKDSAASFSVLRKWNVFSGLRGFVITSMILVFNKLPASWREKIYQSVKQKGFFFRVKNSIFG